MTTTLDQREAKNQSLAEQARQRIDGDPRRLVLFLGTGVSYGMTKRGTLGNKLCSWIPFLEELALRLPDDCAEKTAFDKILGNSSPDSTSVILGLAHMIREKLVSLGTWDSTIQDIAKQIHEAYEPESEWGKFFQAMRDRSVERGRLETPLILTTNYDALLDQTIGAWGLTNPDLTDSHPARSRPTFSLTRTNPDSGEADDALPAYLENLVDAPLLWKMHRNGLLEVGDAFIHHIHGAAALPSTVVFDAADYERAIQTYLWEPLARLLSDDTVVAVFAGVGDGMFDRHLNRMWKELSANLVTAGSEEPSVYWLRAEEERAGAEKQLSQFAQDLPGNTIELVTQPTFDWFPSWINQVFSDENQYNF